MWHTLYFRPPNIITDDGIKTMSKVVAFIVYHLVYEISLSQSESDHLEQFPLKFIFYNVKLTLRHSNVQWHTG